MLLEIAASGATSNSDLRISSFSLLEEYPLRLKELFSFTFGVLNLFFGHLKIIYFRNALCFLFTHWTHACIV